MKRITIACLCCVMALGIGPLAAKGLSQSLPYSTGFEDVQDWKRSRPAKGAAGYDYPAAWAEYNGGNPLYPPPKNFGGTFAFDLFRASATLFEPAKATNILEVGEGFGRNSSRGMLYNVEVSGSNGLWTGGDAMHLWLGATGYKDLYVRFYLKYPPEWKWTDDSNPISNRGAYQKIMKIARYNGTWGDGGNPAQYVAPANGGRVHPVWIPDWYQYISTTPSQTFFYNSERYSPDYSANSPAEDFYSTRPNLYPQGSQFKWPTDSDWHCYEFRAKMNSAPGVADGVSEVWLDGQKVWSKTNVAWVKAGGDVSQGWNDVTVLDNATIPAYPLTSQVTYPLYLDDVVVSTTYSGPPAKPVSVAAKAVSSSSVNLSWSTGNNGATYDTSGYRIYYGTNPASLSSSVTVGNVTQAEIAGLVAGTTYYFSVAAFNKVGTDSSENFGVRSTTVSAVVSDGAGDPVSADTTPPAVSISSPIAGSTVSGTVNLSAAATDSVGVKKVEFYLNGAIYGVVGSTPYTIAWDSTKSADGLYTILVKAYDEAGNVGQQGATVTVKNGASGITQDTTKPTVTITSPAYGSTVSGTAAILTSATDNTAVTKVDFYVNGNLAGTATVAPFTFNWNTSAFANGPYGLMARAYDAAGNVGDAPGVTLYVGNGGTSGTGDSVPPTVSITSPSYASSVSGTAAIQTAASDNVGVTKVELYVNGSLKGSAAAAPFIINWNTSAMANGGYTLTARAYDAAGNVSVSSGHTLFVANDSTAPSVTVTSPAGGSQVAGTVAVAANATDNLAVTKVEFYLNGVLQATSTSAPYGFTWNSTLIANGNHTLSAKAYDAAGNVGQSAQLPVTVLNGDLVKPAVAITSPGSSVVGGSVAVVATASDDVAVQKVEFYLNGALQATSTSAPYGFTWNSALVANGSYILSAKAYDAAGNVGDSAPVTVTASNDLVKPAVAITSPASGAVSGSVVVAASASDNVAVQKVEFYVNGALRSTASAAPYNFTWNSALVPNGSYLLSAKAYDAAGNVGEAAQVAVTVSNDFVNPAVAITSPGSGIVSGAVAVVATASDNVAVQRVEFFLDGAIKATSTQAPYGFTLNTSTIANGVHTLTARAYDAAGNMDESSTAITVLNDNFAPTITSFTMPAVKNSSTVAITAFSAMDDIGVTGYLVTESAAVPSPNAAEWSATAPTSFTFAGTGSRTAYAWAKDASGRISAASSATVIVDTVLPIVSSMTFVDGAASVTVNASGSDNVAVAKMELYVDDALQLETLESSLSYVCYPSYRKSQKITVVVYDTAGNTRSRSIRVSKF